MEIQNDRVSFGISIPLSSFTQFAQAHLNKIPQTPDVEGLALTLIEQDYPDQILDSFIRKVCEWGNYSGLAGRILRRLFKARSHGEKHTKQE